MDNTTSILLIDDDLGVLYTAKIILKQHYQKVVTDNNPVSAYERLKEDRFDIILLDMNFRSGATTGEEGIDWLKKIRELQPEAQVIMHTAYGEIDLAVESMREGAVDFLTKPWEKEKLLSTVNNACNLYKSRKEVKSLKSKQQVLLQEADKEFTDIIGRDKSIKAILNQIEKVASTDAHVLILGENGTGKELIARKIHQQSIRSNEPFVKIDLGAVPETLFESELFGHVKGAFTDAREDRAGRIEIAQGGTLFLDEIGNLNQRLQAKLLSVIQSKSFNKVGSSEIFPVDVRLICATNQDLYEAVEMNQFRQDLLYRINTIEIVVPPLRDRKSDIPLLIDYFLKILTKKYQKKDLRVQPDVYENLKNYPWPGNIRELRHAVERAIIMAEGKVLQTNGFITASNLKHREGPIDSVHMHDVEKHVILEALRKSKGNLTQAATELGIGRTTLYRKMKKYQIK